MIRWNRRRQFGREAGVSFGNPDFVALAEALRAAGYRVESARHLRPTIGKALAQGGVSIIDVPVDYGGNDRLTARMGGLVRPI